MTLKEARQQAGLTQTQVAEALGVLQSAVSHWETGQTAPRSLARRALAELYGVPADALAAASPKKRKGFFQLYGG